MEQAKRQSRRDFLRLATALAVGAVTAACAPATPVVVEKIVEKEVLVTPTPEKPAGPVVVPLWGWWKPRMDFYDKAAKRFQEKNPDVRIDVQTMDYDTLWEKVLPASVAGTGPTILKSKPVYHFKYLTHGLLEPYPEEKFPDSWWKENFSDSWEDYRYEGKNYVYADGGSPNLLMYNRTMFKEAGLDPQAPPETWDELVETGKKLTKLDDAGNIIIAGFMTHHYFWPHCTYQLGGNIVKVLPDGTRESAILSPESVKAFKFFTDLYVKDKIIPAQFLEFVEAIGTRKAAIGHLESYVLGEFTGSFPDTEKELGWAPSPTPTGKPDPSYGLKVIYIGLTVFKNRPAVEKEVALNFIEFLVKECDDILAEIALILGCVVGKVPVRQRPEFQEIEALRVVAEVLPHMKDPVQIDSTELNKLLINARDRVILGGVSADESLQKAHEEFDTLLKTGDYQYLV